MQISFLRTTTFRLTLWYLGVFSTLTLVVFGFFYVFLASNLHRQADAEMLEMIEEFEALYASRGITALALDFQHEMQSEGKDNVFFRLISPDGRKLASSDLAPWGELSNLRLPPSGLIPGKPILRSLSLPGVRYKARVATAVTRSGQVLQVGVTLRDSELLLERYREAFGAALAIMLACGGLVGWLLTRKAMSGVKRITETANRIGRHDFGRRVVTLDTEGEEISALVHEFNDMLERVESLMGEFRHITDNIAHELRTPITRIRGIAETTLKSNGTLDEYREMAAMVIDGSDDLIEMIGTMLEIAETDAGVAELAVTPLDIREMVEEAADLFAPTAEDKGIHLQVEIPPESVGVRADRPRLQRVVANLLDNAIKYTPAGGTVTLSVAATRAGAKVEFTDTGLGIEEKDIPRIFDRFFRCDKSRSTTGSGLGLSLALAIIRAHGGDITVTTTDQGSVFTVFLLSEPSLPQGYLA